jgi:hypothetical protein
MTMAEPIIEQKKDIKIDAIDRHQKAWRPWN